MPFLKPLFLFLLLVCARSSAANHPNILFIAVDDLRPELGCYDSPIAVTPNLDALANDGLLFNRAYCQQAICRPSRASLMTGARPETTGLFHNYVSLRELQPDIVTLPQHLISHGYETVYCGKIFHQGDTDEENSWSRAPVKRLQGVKQPVGPYALAENNQMKADNMKTMLAKYGEAARRGLAAGPAYEKADVADTAYIDGYNTQLAIATMKEMAKNDDKPFFLGMGYKLPHLNWCARRSTGTCTTLRRFRWLQKRKLPRAEPRWACTLRSNYAPEQASPRRVRSDPSYREHSSTHTWPAPVTLTLKSGYWSTLWKKPAFATTRSSSSGEITAGTLAIWESGARRRTTRLRLAFL